MIILPLAAADDAAVQSLLDEAFGADRRARTAYRLRDGAVPSATQSFAAFDDAGLAGSIQCWPIAIVRDDGSAPMQATLLGPVAVALRCRGQGVGAALMHRALAAIDNDGGGIVVLVGDADYYGRFGFSAAATGGWTLPGPVERHRLLARVSGALVPGRAALAPWHAVSTVPATTPAPALP